MKMIFKSCLASLLLLLNGCMLFFHETSTQTVSRSPATGKSYIVVKTFHHSHCGCTDIYAQQYLNGYKVYELYPGCTPFFSPHKIIYSYDAEGNLVNKSSYVAVKDGSFTMPLSETDSMAMNEIGNYQKLHPGAFAKCNQPIRGFKPDY